MKKIILSGIILLLAMLTSCADRSFQGDGPDTPDIEILDEPVPVLLAIGDPSYTVLSRGNGAFNPLPGMHADTLLRDKSTFHIYAFSSDDNVDFSGKYADNKEVPDNCLVDGTHLGDNNMKGGMPAVFNRDDYAYLLWQNDTEINYNTTHQSRPYTFYAFYVDDLFTNNIITDKDISRTSDQISFPVQIDGRQDLMSSVATLSETQLGIINGMSVNERNNMLNYHFSAYTAHRGVHPYFQFKHHMARLKFQIYAGDSIKAGKVVLDTISVKANTIGKFVVVSKNTDEIGLSDWTNMKSLYLTESDGSDLRQDFYKAIWQEGDKSKDVYDRKATDIGSDLLLPPDDSYDLLVRFKQTEDNGIVRYFTTPQNIKNNGGFKPGYIYNVRIAVYGDIEIQISIEIEQWKDGGNTDVDPDNEFEF